ncbi:LITAF-like zinc ribbon domain protein (macronuclear) [Tetrahymena thermophila SB210]|uniref:LITAF-like zinc ribbon domain protein n=1 Tax=Tetrahymena thermophila (strain SB210) TaxID=312017 RepID=Q23YV8_TETTS|nr:LITAF-like zinc ribbon domain protein [Tetrahymena thermophila SB210]EAS01697.2 LITAF-like zinc ribbon domain protein [Tetrahymena thermophila SB210]|eukprot:XP_001021942.2 LITAF-like zinc ribbon domain protein [Tetrahymena thermophila SB210]
MYSNQQAQGYPHMQSQQLPQPQMYPPPANSQPVSATTLQPLVSNSNLNLCPYPSQTFCTNCQQNITTVITNQSGTGTYQCCFLLLFFTGCFCIPFCIDNCKDKIHSCPKCESQLGYFEYKLC